MRSKGNMTKFLAVILSICMVICNNSLVFATEAAVSADQAENRQEETVSVSEGSADESNSVSSSELPSEDTGNTAGEEAAYGEDIDIPAGGYIEMPWDNDTPIADPGISFEQAKAMIVSDGVEEAAGGDVEIPAAYPCSHSNNDSLKSYINSDLMPLRNQNPYGTCWAHSAISLLEGYMLSNSLSDKNGQVTRDVDYSELQLAYNYFHTNTNPITGNDGGDTISTVPSTNININPSNSFLDIGGNIGLAAQSLINWHGAVSDNGDAAYANAVNIIQDDNGKKAISSSLDEINESDDLVHLTNEYEINIKENADNVKQAIRSNGLVGASIYAANQFYNSATNSYYTPGNYSTNHAVTIVGWDDNFPASSFGNYKPGSNGAWLIRNSWKYDNVNELSYNGYFWLSYADQSLADTAYVYEAESADNYDNNYYYTNQIHNTGYSSANKAANIFTVCGTGNSENERLEAVSVEVMKGAPYTISIQSVNNNGEPSGTPLAADTTGTFPYAGIYTIPLKESIDLQNGEKFAVVVISDANTIVKEANLRMAGDNVQVSGTVSIGEGESFWGDTNYGDYWGDCVSDAASGYGNYCINAFTSNVSSVTPVEQTASNFTFSAEGGTYNGSAYTANVTPKVGSKTVTVYYKKSGSSDAWSTDAPKDAGTYVVAVDYPAVTGYNAASKLSDNSWTFTISPKSITGVTISGVTDKGYTGSAISQENITVKDGSLSLTENTDYTISYKNNVDIGTATLSITGKGNYTGNRSVDFKITGCYDVDFDVTGASAITYGQSLADSTITYTAEYNGVDVAGSCSFEDTDIKPVVADSNSTEYSVVFTPDDTSTYNSASAKVTLTVNKANPELSASDKNVLDNLTVDKGGVLSDITSDLPLYCSWDSSVDTSTEHSIVGEVINAKVIYNPDSNNYNDLEYTATIKVVGLIDVDFVVTGASAITYGQSLADSVITYTAMCSGENVAGSCSFEAPETRPLVSDSNTTEYTVIFTPEDKSKYNPASAKVTLTVKKADAVISASDRQILDSLTIKPGSSLASVTLPAGYTWGPSVDTSAKHDTVGEVIRADVIYNPDSANYNNAEYTATVRVAKTSVKISVTNGKALLNGKEVSIVEEGDSITLVADDAPLTKMFDKWTVTGAVITDNKETTTLVAGSSDITAIASYKDDPDYTNEEEPEIESEEGVVVRSITLLNDEDTKVTNLNLALGDSAFLFAKVVMKSGDEPDTIFRSENTDIVRVSSDGQVIGYGQGSTVVTAYCGNKKAKCTVTVTDIITGVSVNAAKPVMGTGETIFLSASTEPLSSIANKKLKWSIDNSKVASIKSGNYGCLLTAKKAGTVNVTVRVETIDENYEKVVFDESIEVKITDASAVKNSSKDKSYKLSFKKKTVKAKKGESVTVTAVLSKAAAAEGKTLNWESTNSNVVKISESENKASVAGKKANAKAIIEAVGLGTAYVTVTATDNESGDTNIRSFKVVVSNPVTAISITSDSEGLLGQEEENVIYIRKGSKDNLILSVTPGDATNINSVKWAAKGGVTVKNGTIYAKSISKVKKSTGVTTPAKVTVKCGNIKHVIYVYVTK